MFVVKAESNKTISVNVRFPGEVLSFSANKQQQIQIFLVKENIFHEFSYIYILIFVIFCLLSFSHKQ